MCDMALGGTGVDTRGSNKHDMYSAMVQTVNWNVQRVVDQRVSVHRMIDIPFTIQHSHRNKNN